jgi:hypothetical protein
MSTSLTYFAHFEGDMKGFEKLLGAAPDVRIECSCGPELELRGDKAVHSKLARDWRTNHSGAGHAPVGDRKSAIGGR